MPYANIYWIKLKLEILNDKRFIFDCNNDQKWLYIGLLLLAGNTDNKIPNDENYLKNRLNLPEETPKIRENLQFLLDTFPKLISNNGVLKFKNFKMLHNRLGNSEGTPMELQRGVQIRTEQIKIRIDKILHAFLDKKHYSKEKEKMGIYYRRYTRTIKRLLILADGNADKIIDAMNWLGDLCNKKSYYWELETIEKWLPEYIAKGEKAGIEAWIKE